MPPSVRTPCAGTPLPAGPKPGEADYQVFGLRQTLKVEQCDGKRALGVEAMDLHNRYVDRLVDDLAPRPWWKFW